MWTHALLHQDTTCCRRFRHESSFHDFRFPRVREYALKLHAIQPTAVVKFQNQSQKQSKKTASKQNQKETIIKNKRQNGHQANKIRKKQ